MNRSILLAGGKISGLAYIATLLEQSGYVTAKCSDIPTLDHLLRIRQFDLVIVDDRKPTLCTVDIFQHLLNSPATASLPMVFLISADSSGIRELVPEASAGNTLTKPIQPYLLIKMVADAVSPERSSCLRSTMASECPNG